MAVASADINMQIKHNVICHVTKVKPATSGHSMADVIPFFSVFNIRFESNASIKPKENILIHNKENNIRNIFGTFMFQQLLANKHHRLRDFEAPNTIWPSGGLRLVTDKKKKITRSCYSNLKPRLYFWLINSFLSRKSRLNLIRLYYE